MPDNEKATLLTVGSVAFDSVETPVGSVAKALGGSATFAALAASYFAEPQIVAVVGDDFEERHFERFHERGIDTSGIEKVPGKTFHWKGRYHDNMQDRDTLETHLNVFESFDPVVPESFRSSEYVFLGNIDPKIQLKVLQQVKDKKLVGMDTMNFWIENSLDELKEVFKWIDIQFINDEEACQLAEEKQVLVAAEKILALGPRFVVIKRGEFGSLLFGHEVCLFVPAVLLPKVVDPTGAGDAFAGGFLGWMAKSGSVNRQNLALGMIYGTVMASFAVENFSVDGLLQHDEATINLRREFLESMTEYK